MSYLFVSIARSVSCSLMQQKGGELIRLVFCGFQNVCCGFNKYWIPFPPAIRVVCQFKKHIFKYVWLKGCRLHSGTNLAMVYTGMVLALTQCSMHDCFNEHTIWQHMIIKSHLFSMRWSHRTQNRMRYLAVEVIHS